MNEACSSAASKTRERAGWISPRKDGALIYTNHHQWMIALEVEQRLLPSSVINETTQERADQITEQQGHPPGRQQLKKIKERVIEELMPRAFTKRRTTFSWIDRSNGWMIIDGSASRAEEVIEHLRHCLNDFPLLPTHTTLSPCSVMADWLAGSDAPEGFSIDRDCELQSAGEEKEAIAYKHCMLDPDRIRADLASGKRPKKLAFTWDDRISFVLTEDLDIKRVAFLDILKEQADKNADTAEEQFDADFALMTGELTRFLPALINALGGIRIDLAEQGMNFSVSKTVECGDQLQAIDGNYEIASDAKPAPRAARVTIQYQHPEEPSLQWSGRGRKPKWVEAFLAQGNTLDNLKITGAAA